MTVKRTVSPIYAPGQRFPLRPTRGDMQNWIHLGLPGHLTALIQHFGSPETTIVMSEMALGRNLSDRDGIVYPDLLVAFNVIRDASYQRLGYSLDEWGKPPEFALEIASPSTAGNDYGEKRTKYANFGVLEYWRFNPLRIRRHGPPLSGDRLEGGEYRPATIVEVDGDRCWGHSEALNLSLCCEDRQLRWWDPVEGRYLLTHSEETAARVAEHQARIAAESQRDAERQGRIAAEARVRQLEEELRRRSQ